MDFFKDETGAASIEIGIITVVLVAVALLFKESILDLCKAIAERILG